MKKELKCLLYYLENIGANLRVIQLFSPPFYESVNIRAHLWTKAAM